MKKILLLLSWLSLLQLSPSVHARPEYAVQYGTIRCSTCHISPYGGGARTVTGKLYGSRNYGAGKTSQQDLGSGDIRMMLIEPSKATKKRNGLALMAATVTANVPIIQSETGTETRIVSAYSSGVLSSGIRETYIYYRMMPESQWGWFRHFIFGRVNSPYGLLTDEHRTYVRIQNKTSENDYEMGGVLSGDPDEQVHYDIALTNGFQSGGTQVNGDVTWAATGNVRFQPPRLPFFLGTSGSYHQSTITDSPYSVSLYGALSADRLTHNRVRGSLLAEAQIARRWNDPTTNAGLNGYFTATDTSFKAAVKNSQSLGYYVLANYDLTTTLTLVYKFDQFTFDKRFKGDAYTRHGIGFKYFMNSNMNLLLRYEFCKTGRSTIKSNEISTATNDVIAVLHVTL